MDSVEPIHAFYLSFLFGRNTYKYTIMEKYEKIGGARK